ncbi:MAG: Gx transporter family protein [Treponema sp.]|nr:Gx transporter family protein [Treponema sp.]
MPGGTLAFFASLCLFLSSVEYAIPKPLPFMRLGLANLPVIFAVKSFRFRDILILILLKVILSSVISGTTISYVFLFSAAGSLSSGLAVFALYTSLKKTGLDRHISNIGLCLTGALANNAAQIAVARLIMFGSQAYLIAPLLLASGLVSGMLLGLFANTFESRSRFLSAVRNGAPCGKPEAIEKQGEITAESAAPRPKDLPQACLAAVSMLLMLAMLALPFFNLANPLRLKILFWLLLLVSDEICRKGKVRLLPSIAIILSMTALSLLSPAGKVLYTLGSLRITQGALETGLSKGLTLTGMLFASQALFASAKGWCFMNGGKPGRIFTIFAALSERKLAIKELGIINALDEQLCTVWESNKSF